MGIRSAFNPLGTLPYVSVSYGIATVTWTIDNIPVRSGTYANRKDALVLPSSWNIGGTTVALGDINYVSDMEDTNHADCRIVYLSYTFPSAGYVESTVSENDTNFDDGTAD